ncbi:MAG: ParB/RepB/Spo0J family partition protein [Acidocella sp.]|nr:ParB/RepB/Spo0J family partition protein [Acidocella sp.]
MPRTVTGYRAILAQVDDVETGEAGIQQIAATAPATSADPLPMAADAPEAACATGASFEAAAATPLALSSSRDIPLDRLKLSQNNVRQIKAGLSIGDLAEDIARRTLLQSLSVREIADDAGEPTGHYEIPAGGRRFRALQLLVEQGRLAPDALIPCVLRQGGMAQEDSLAENIHREALHPLDQYRAFQALRDKGLSEEDIAARFFVSAAIVRQRLRLASVSPKLLGLYGENAMTLEQLMAFSVSTDHARQEQVWEAVTRSYNQNGWQIRQQLTSLSLRGDDRRVIFVGLETYEAAGGPVLRDLFSNEGVESNDYVQDVGLLEKLALTRLQREAEGLSGEGWKWIEVSIDLSHGQTPGLRRLTGQRVDPTGDEQARLEALSAEHDALEDQWQDSDDVPDDVIERLETLAQEIHDGAHPPLRYLAEEKARAGVFLSVGYDGGLRVERGYVRRDDDWTVSAYGLPAPSIHPMPKHPGAADADQAAGGDGTDAGSLGAAATTIISNGGPPVSAAPEHGAADDEGALRPLSDLLVTELTAARTLALRLALAQRPDIAFRAALHALCLNAFYHSQSQTCLELRAISQNFGRLGPAIGQSLAAQALDLQHEARRSALPENAALLWEHILAMGDGDAMALFSYCAALCVNVVQAPQDFRDLQRRHGGQLADAVGLNMAQGWVPTVANYLGRVAKARILEAVGEARGEQARDLIAHLKKPDMAREAERLLDGSGWLPEPLRSVEAAQASADNKAGTESEAESRAALPAFLEAGDSGDTGEDLGEAGEDLGDTGEDLSETDQHAPHAIAAE